MERKDAAAQQVHRALSAGSGGGLGGGEAELGRWVTGDLAQRAEDHQGGRDEQVAGHQECRGGGGEGSGGIRLSGMADDHRWQGAQGLRGGVIVKPLCRIASTRSSSGTRSLQRSDFQHLVLEDLEAVLAFKPCSRIVCLNEVQSSNVTSEAARASYAVMTEAQNGQCLLRVGMSGRRGAGLASSTLGLVM